ncbi:hypothetical protein SASC598O11_002180, partial [Snodgrassella alvi SCGC AB-598-O11]
NQTKINDLIHKLKNDKIIYKLSAANSISKLVSRFFNIL